MSVSSGNNSSMMSSLRSSFSSAGGFKIGTKPVADDQVAPVVPSNQNQVMQPTQSTQSTQHNHLDQSQADQAGELNVAEQILSQFGQDNAQVSSVPGEVTVPTPDAAGSLAQAMPQTLTAVIPDPLNPPNPTPVGTTKKETYQVGPAIAETPAPTPEYPGGVQSVEQEKTPEIAPEIESFLRQAEQQPDQLPQEIVIADNQEVSSVAHHPKQPVVVLPITAKVQDDGKKKDFRLSVRWLVEWSVKIMKKFSGKVIYKEE